ncbi:MAG TPA: response regulator, partial [Dehalococcoidia bacterium]
SQLLKKEGYSVETFDNGREALSRIKKDGYDLILLDVKLPGMSGSEVYERIREISVSLTKRVVFITGDVMGADTESFLARTKAPFIAKPFNLENLKEQIISLLADKHAGNVTRSKPRAKSKKLKAKARK